MFYFFFLKIQHIIETQFLSNLWMVVCFTNTLLLIGVFSGESIKMAQNLQEITNKIKSEGMLKIYKNICYRNF